MAQTKYIVGGIINPQNGQTAEELLLELKSGFKIEKFNSKSLGIVTRSNTAVTQEPTLDEEGFVIPKVMDYPYSAFLNHTKKATNAQLLKAFSSLSFVLQTSTIEDTGEVVIRFLIPAK